MGKQNLYDQLLNQKKKVDFNTYDFSIKELISLVSDKIVNIAPDYQRQFRWDDVRQSSLVESIFLAYLFLHCLWHLMGRMGTGNL